MSALPGLPRPKARPSAAARTGVPRSAAVHPGPTLHPGDRAPDFLLPDTSRNANPFNALVRGDPIALIFLGEPARAPAAGALADIAARLTRAGAQVFCLVAGGLEPVIRWHGGAGPEATVLVDPEAHVTADYGLAADRAPRICLLDRTRRLVCHAPAGGLMEQAGHIEATLADLLDGEGQPYAPILEIPRILAPDVCRELIDIWHRGGNVETGTIGYGGRGLDEVSLRHDVKKRRDHHVRDPALAARLRQTLLPRLRSELKQAFDADVREVEEFKIVRYDAAEGGYFRPHRDNHVPERAGRRFAMTLNLNAEAYEGGCLRFPEYGARLYKPRTGDAAVFSCSLLHEATDVTSGARFAVLSFLRDSRSADHERALAKWYREARGRLEGALTRTARPGISGEGPGVPGKT